VTIGLRDSSLGALISRAQAGSHEAIEEIVIRYRDRLMRFVRVRDRGDATEDICHSILVSVMTGISSLKEPESFESWLFQIARNACLESARRERLRRIFIPIERKHEDFPLTASEIDAKLDEFKAVVDKMPDSQRELILMLLDRDLSYEELATVTGTTVSSVKSKLFRARAFLRQNLSVN